MCAHVCIYVLLVFFFCVFFFGGVFEVCVCVCVGVCKRKRGVCESVAEAGKVAKGLVWGRVGCGGGVALL